MQRNTIVVRIARKGDEKALIKCFVELQNYERLIEPRRQPGEQIAGVYIKRLMDDCAAQEGRIYVASAGDKIVGFIAVFPEVVLDEQINEPTTVAYISDLVVSSDSRKQGIGQMLMHSAEKFAKDRGAKSITVNVLAANGPACKFYSTCGYNDYERLMVKRLK